VQEQSATYAITVNPLVNWVWFGFGIIAIGSLIAMLPERAYSFATARVPVGATTTVLLLMLLPASLFAQSEAVQSVVPQPRSELRRQLEGDIMCPCGCRAPMNDCPMGPSCHGLQEMNPKLDKLLAQGLNRSQVRAALVAEAGGEHVLTAPIDQGFNRLAWLLPYAVGVGGALAAAVVAIRWSRTDGTDRQPPATQDDPDLGSRLDDELRDLD
jgi:cytochrome c-type biogenesis protein CcmH/NrfF